MARRARRGSNPNPVIRGGERIVQDRPPSLRGLPLALVRLMTVEASAVGHIGGTDGVTYAPGRLLPEGGRFSTSCLLMLKWNPSSSIMSWSPNGTATSLR